MFNRRMRQEHPSDGSGGMRSPGLWLGAMVAVVAMGFVALVNMGGAASGSTIMKPNGSESMTASESGDKVMICHRLGNGGGFNLMEIELSALDSHIAHGDIYPTDGVCIDSSESATATETATSTPTPTVTVTVSIPGPGSTTTVTSTETATATATATVTATPTITPAPGVVESPPITPAPGTVEESVAPLPATVPAGGGGEAPGGSPIWALFALTAAVIAGIGASVRLAQRTSR